MCPSHSCSRRTSFQELEPLPKEPDEFQEVTNSLDLAKMLGTAPDPTSNEYRAQYVGPRPFVVPDEDAARGVVYKDGTAPPLARQGPYWAANPDPRPFLSACPGALAVLMPVAEHRAQRLEDMARFL